MQTELYEQVFGTIDGTDSYIFIPTDEVVKVIAETYEIGLEELKRIAEKLELQYNLIASKSSFEDGFLRLESDIKMTFDTETLELDGIEVLDSFEENGNTYITINGFPISARQDDQIRAVIDQIFESSRQLKRLNKDTLEKILSMANPQDVAKLCQTNDNYKNLCRDPNVFKRLLDKHYPNAVYTNDPRKQFIAITKGIKTFYRMKLKDDETEEIIPGHDGVYRYHYEDVEQMHEPSRIEEMEGWSVENMPGDLLWVWNGGDRDIRIAAAGLPEKYSDTIPHGDYLIFYVDGLSIPPGETLFLLQDTGNEFLHDAKVFKRREDLAEEYVRNYDIYVNALMEEFLDSDEAMYEDIEKASGDEKFTVIRGLGLEKRFNQYITNLGVQLPFTKEGLRERAMRDENLYLYPDTYHYQYQVIEVTF